MTEQQPHPGDETPTVEVRVFRYGELVHTKLCESEEQAVLVVEEWSELHGVRCEVHDLTTKDRSGDDLELGPAAVGEEDYPPSG